MSSASESHASSTTQGTLKIDESITSWTLDAGRQQIYAGTEEGSLLIISEETFSVLKSIDVGSGPVRDLDLIEDSLWLSTEEDQQAVNVDLNSNTVIQKIKLNKEPDRIEVIDNRLYYSNQYDVYFVNSDEGTEEGLSSLRGLAHPDLESTDSGELIATGSVNFDVYKFNESNELVQSTATMSPIKEGRPSKNVLLDGEEIFYAGKSYDLNQLDRVNGDYIKEGYKETFYAVTDNFVFSQVAIYSRHTYLKVADLSFETRYILAESMDQVYLYDSDTSTIYKKNFNLDSSFKPQQTTVINQKLSLQHDITSWVKDDENNLIYAVSRTNNSLLTIDMATLEVINERYIGSNPIDLVRTDNGKLYIANSGATQITIIDGGEKSTFSTSVIPYQITTDGQSLYYASDEVDSHIYEVQLDSLKESLVTTNFTNSTYRFARPSLAYDSNQDVIIAGERSMGGLLYSIQPDDLTIKESESDNSYGYEKPSYKIFVDSQHIYHAQQQISEQDITNITHHFDEDIIHVSNQYVVTDLGVYDKEDLTKKVISFPYEDDQVEEAVINQQGELILYVVDQGSPYVLKYDELKSVNEVSPLEVQSNWSGEDLTLSWYETKANQYKVMFKTNNMQDFFELTQVNDTSYQLTNDERSMFNGENVSFVVKPVVGKNILDGEKVEVSFEHLDPINKDFSKTVELDITDMVQSDHAFEHEVARDAISIQLVSPLLFNMNLTDTKYFKLESRHGTLTFPMELMRLMSFHSDSKLKLEIKSVTGEVKKRAEDRFNEIVSPFVDFSLVKNTNGESKTINSFIGHITNYPKRQISIDVTDPSQLTVVMDQKGRIKPVPSRIVKDENGQYRAEFYQEGNYTYYVVRTDNQVFVDLSEKHWANKSVDYLSDHLIVHGIGDSQFAPDQHVTRAEFAAFITRALGLQSDDTPDLIQLKDVNPIRWYADSVFAAEMADLVSGYEDHTFRPHRTITREEMVVMIIRALQHVNGPLGVEDVVIEQFKDANQVKPWAVDNMNKAISLGIMAGRTEDQIVPQGTVTRAEAAAMINRMIKQFNFMQ
ncbi:hypothetical protein E3U55_14220 [Filobacillus milosensis]|uniref:SLH domain-containing protein n=1 Tax=Filobacillus milosensis TaxID=94137 RepID=A0A4Y8IGP5_9BACI|nr:S-layer homology domain-containing protein [Filobacillus milosensis]TFB14201.1 hypothetical protein E3U55_14220 [Filobacillus milosensis]